MESRSCKCALCIDYKGTKSNGDAYIEALMCVCVMQVILITHLMVTVYVCICMRCTLAIGIYAIVINSLKSITTPSLAGARVPFVRDNMFCLSVNRIFQGVYAPPSGDGHSLIPLITVNVQNQHSETVLP